MELDRELDFHNPSTLLSRINSSGATVICDAAIGPVTHSIGHVAYTHLSVCIFTPHLLLRMVWLRARTLYCLNPTGQYLCQLQLSSGNEARQGCTYIHPSRLHRLLQRGSTAMHAFCNIPTLRTNRAGIRPGSLHFNTDDRVDSHLSSTYLVWKEPSALQQCWTAQS